MTDLEVGVLFVVLGVTFCGLGRFPFGPSEPVGDLLAVLGLIFVFLGAIFNGIHASLLRRSRGDPTRG